MNKSNTNKILDLIDNGDKNLEDLLEEYIIDTKKNPFKKGEFSDDFLIWKKNKEKNG
jgi:hypothetical protein